MKNELKKELQNAQNNRPSSGFGFGKLSELDEKLKAVKREIYRHHDFTQTPELTAMVNEVLELAEEIDPDYHGSRRQRGKYGLLKEYRHCWKRHKEVMTECPISDDSVALLEFVPSLHKLITRNNPEKQIMDEKGNLKWVDLEEEEITEEMKVMKKWGKWITRYAGDIEFKCKLFLYNNALPLLKKAKKLGLTINRGFELDVKQFFQKDRYGAQEEESLKDLLGILLSYLGRCQVANFLMNQITEHLEFTRDLLDKAIASYKKGVKELCEFLKGFSEKITKKAQSFIMHLLGDTGDHGSKMSRNGRAMEGLRVKGELNYGSLPIPNPYFNS